MPQGELDYDFDFSKQDFTIYAGGTYDLGLTPAYIQDQTFRIVVIPGYFSNRGGKPIVDKNSIIKIISKYNKDLSSQINKMDICKIEHPKTKNAYKSSIAQLTKAFDSNENILMINLKSIISISKIWLILFYVIH